MVSIFLIRCYHDIDITVQTLLKTSIPTEALTVPMSRLLQSGGGVASGVRRPEAIPLLSAREEGGGHHAAAAWSLIHIQNIR